MRSLVVAAARHFVAPARVCDEACVKFAQLPEHAIKFAPKIILIQFPGMTPEVKISS